MFREGKFLILGVCLFLFWWWTISQALNFLGVSVAPPPLFLVWQAQNVPIRCIPQRSQWLQTQNCWSNPSHIWHDCTSRVEDLNDCTSRVGDFKSSYGGGYLMTLCPLMNVYEKVGYSLPSCWVKSTGNRRSPLAEKHRVDVPWMALPLCPTSDWRKEQSFYIFSAFRPNMLF